MRRLLLILALVLLLLAAGTYWLAGREATLRWALGQVVAATNGQLQFEGVSGNLLGAVRVEQGRFSSPKTVVTADHVAFDFSLGSLLRRRLKIDQLQAASVLVKLTPSDEPLQPPASLALPIGIEVTRIQIGLIEIQRGDLAVVLRDLQARLVSTGNVHSLDLQRLVTPWGRANGTLNLEGRFPFALRSTAELIPLHSDMPQPRIRLELQGPLAGITAQLKAESAWLQAAATAVIRPFQPLQLGGLKADLAQLDLHALKPSLPRAILSGHLTAMQSQDTQLTGQVDLTNRTPGALAQNSLPLTTLAARFTLDPDRLVLDDLQLGVRLGATLTGKARLDADGLNAQLASKGLDLQAFHEKMAPTRLAGNLQIQADPKTQRLVATMADARQHYEIDALRQGAQIRLSRARVRNAGSQIDLQGDLTTAGAWPFTAQAKLVRLDPSAFGDFPSARINASVTGRGQFKPGWQVQFKADIHDSLYRHQRLSGHVEASVMRDRVWDSRGEISWGDSHAGFKGAIGAAGDQLDVDFSIADLQPLDDQWTGQVKGSATLSGPMQHPGVVVEAVATRLEGPHQLSIGSANLTAHVLPNLDAPLAVEAQLGKVKLDDLAVDTATLSINGTGRAHRGKLVVAGADLALEASLAGGLNQEMTWQGKLEQLRLDKPRAFRLESPASLAVGHSALRLGQASLSAGQAQFHLDGFNLTPMEMRTAGRFTGLPVAMLGLPLHQELRSDGSLGGEWNITATDTLNGNLKLWHETGKWVVEGVTLRPTHGFIDATARDNRVEVKADLTLKNGSKLDLQFATEVAKDKQLWTIPNESPLSLRATGSVTSIDWLGPLLLKDLDLEGRIDLDIAAQGNWKHPKISGQIEGQNIGIRHLASGLSFSDGTLHARLEGEQIILDKIELKTGEGRLQADGRAQLGEQPELHLHLQGENLALVERKDLDLDTNLVGDLVLDKRGAQLTAKVKVNRGLMVLGGNYAPSLSEDVRIKGQTPKAKAEQQALGLGLDVLVDLGNDFQVRSSEKSQLLGGRLPFQTSGFRSRIAGQVRLRGERGKTVRSQGEIKVVNGSYSLLGQRLNIERGNILFDGPLQNPNLDVSAVREKPEMKVGMSITGTAQNPRVSLFSDPDVPDQEKMSWLLFGRGGQPVDTSLSSATGSLSAGLTSFGVQLSDKLSVAYEQGATGTENFVTFYTNINKRLSAEASAGDITALRLFYTFTFGGSK
jgi:translocation and assembly module TamB